MKKTLLRISVVVLVFTCVSGAYFTKAHDAVNVQETTEIPVFDLKKDPAFDNGKLITTGNLTNEDGTIYSVDVYELDAVQSDQNVDSIENKGSGYTYVADLSTAKLVTQRGKIEAKTWDVSQSVFVYCTIHYNKFEESPGDWTALLTAVEGGYEIREAGVAVTDQTIVYGCYKPTLFKKETQNLVQHPVKNHYYYDTEFENYVSLEKGIINCEYTLKMTRGSSELLSDALKAVQTAN